MSTEKKLFTSESVTEGHPDKICDQIADAILDSLLRDDPESRVACEVTCTTGMVNVFGEITTRAYADIPGIVRNTIREIGYTSSVYGFDADTCGVNVSIDNQSADIALGVDRSLESKNADAVRSGHACSGEADALPRPSEGEGVSDGQKQLAAAAAEGVGKGPACTGENEGLKETGDNEKPADVEAGAGDQGLMFGYACRETPELMPYPIMLAHRLAKRLTDVRKDGTLPYLRPDGKTQVSVEYDEAGNPLRLEAVVLSTQHSADIDMEVLRRDIRKQVFDVILPPSLVDDNTKFFINPTGRFVIGGPHGDSGLTGRKIIVDTYGGYARHGGGAFSGKDPSKVDRTASYAARYVAKNLVAAGLCDRCEIQLSYAIGVAEPTSVMIDTFGTGRCDSRRLVQAVRNVFDLRPTGMIRMLDLKRPIYRPTAAYGHFGRTDIDLPWERTDKVDALLKELSGLD